MSAGFQRPARACLPLRECVSPRPRLAADMRRLTLRRSVNVIEGEPVDRQMTTGNHTVRDIYCVKCGETLGWKYVCTPARRAFRTCYMGDLRRTRPMSRRRSTRRASTSSSATCSSMCSEPLPAGTSGPATHTVHTARAAAHTRQAPTSYSVPPVQVVAQVHAHGPVDVERSTAHPISATTTASLLGFHTAQPAACMHAYMRINYALWRLEHRSLIVVGNSRLGLPINAPLPLGSSSSRPLYIASARHLYSSPPPPTSPPPADP